MTYIVELLVPGTRPVGATCREMATNRLVDREGRLSDGPLNSITRNYDPALHVLPAPALPYPCADIRRVSVTIQDEAPRGWYSLSVHALSPDGGVPIATASALGITRFFHDPSGELDAEGRPTAGCASQIINVFGAGGPVAIRP